MDGVSDVSTFESLPLCAVVVTCNGNLHKGATTLKIGHTVKQAANCTARGVAAASRANCFFFDTIFLLGEGERKVACSRIVNGSIVVLKMW